MPLHTAPYPSRPTYPNWLPTLNRTLRNSLGRLFCLGQVSPTSYTPWGSRGANLFRSALRLVQNRWLARRSMVCLFWETSCESQKNLLESDGGQGKKAGALVWGSGKLETSGPSIFPRCLEASVFSAPPSFQDTLGRWGMVRTFQSALLVPPLDRLKGIPYVLLGLDVSRDPGDQ